MLNNLLLLVILFGFGLSGCPIGFYEDDCGNCWKPYCLNIDGTLSYDITQYECILDTQTWVTPGDSNDIFFNQYCDECPEMFYPDDCGNCWMGFCYTLFSLGFDGFPHSVYYDLTPDECEEYGWGFYPPGNENDPYFNSNCLDECVIIGDVNFDGDLNILDVISLIENIINQTLDQVNCGDVTNDQEVDILDVVSIVNTILQANR